MCHVALLCTSVCHVHHACLCYDTFTARSSFTGGQPKGISVVWKNLMPELAKNFGGPASNESRLVFIDRTPGHGISQHIARQPFVEHLKLEGDLSLEDAISKKVMAGYAFDDAARLPERDEDTAVNRNRPIVVFMSTYYNWPKIDGMCNVLMYHDLIPERVGMYAGPGMSSLWLTCARASL